MHIEFLDLGCKRILEHSGGLEEVQVRYRHQTYIFVRLHGDGEYSQVQEIHELLKAWCVGATSSAECSRDSVKKATLDEPANEGEKSPCLPEERRLLK